MAQAEWVLPGVLADRYALERELGRGGMATVYLALDLRYQRRVALKVLRPELAMVVGRERFAREIAIAAQLSHPHILPLHDSGTVERAPGPPVLFYAMPYVASGSLRDRLRGEPQLPLEEALRLTHQVADALDHAHRHGIIHRDIKPENILLAAGEAMVVDFGIARVVDAAGEERLTETGLALGTPAYMSPEQAAGSARLDARSDLYALGCVLYEMLAGQPPFSGPSSQAILARHAVDPVPALRTVRPTVPVALEQVVTRALAKVPADRFPTARAFADALTGALSAAPAPPLAATTTLVTSGPQASRRMRTWTAAALAAVAVAVAAMAGLRPRHPSFYAPDRVVVAPIENQTGDSAVSDFAWRLSSTLPDAIAREGVGDPVPAATARDALARAKGSPGEVAERLARETGAGLELRGVCTRAGAAGTTCQIDVLRMPTKALRMSVSLTGDPTQSVFGAALAERVLVALFLQRTYGDQVTWQGEYIPRSLAAARAFETEFQGPAEAARLDTAWVDAAVFATDDSSGEAAESTFVRLLRRPGLLSSELENLTFQLAARRADPELAFRLARRRFAVNPARWRNPLMVYALQTDRPHAALRASAEPDSASAPADTRPDAQILHLRGYALHQLGRYGEELEVARLIAVHFPADVERYRTQEIMALAALGEVDSVRRRLAEWEGTPETAGWAGTRAFVAGQELMAHGHEREGREVLVGALPFYRKLRETGAPSFTEVLLLDWVGQLEDARRLAEAALRTAGDATDSLTRLGELGAIAAQQGRQAEAAGYDRLLALEHRRGLASFAAGQRASIASRLGDRQGAVRLLEESRAGGFDYWAVHRSPALASLRDYPPFKRFLEPRD